jgi:hypothetical protein
MGYLSLSLPGISFGVINHFASDNEPGHCAVVQPTDGIATDHRPWAWFIQKRSFAIHTHQGAPDNVQ